MKLPTKRQAGESSAAPENDDEQEPADVDQPDASDEEAEAVPPAVTSDEVQIEQPEAGAEFQVYLASAGSYENAKESERDILLTDSYGFAQSEETSLTACMWCIKPLAPRAKIRPGFLRVHFRAWQNLLLHPEQPHLYLPHPL